jgi:hypothetical protein
MRGRVQVSWSAPDETRANNQRTWLNAQLSGRGYISEDLPQVALVRTTWLTYADVGFDTTQEGDTVKTLCLSRQNADPTILAGSWTQFHECPHEEGTNVCSDTVERITK